MEWAHIHVYDSNLRVSAFVPVDPCYKRGPAERRKPRAHEHRYVGSYNELARRQCPFSYPITSRYP